MDESHSPMAEAVRTFHEDGVVVLPSVEGRRLFVVRGDRVGLGAEDIMCAYEGGGCFVFQADREMNPYRLVGGGFPHTVVGSVSALLNAIIGR